MNDFSRAIWAGEELNDLPKIGVIRYKSVSSVLSNLQSYEFFSEFYSDSRQKRMILSFTVRI